MQTTRHMNCILALYISLILKKLEKQCVWGEDGGVWSRLRHILRITLVPYDVYVCVCLSHRFQTEMPSTS